MALTFCSCDSGSENYNDDVDYNSSYSETVEDEDEDDISVDDNKEYETKQDIGKDDELNDGEYYCMGKNDTCNNKTYSPTDLYCHSCDPDDNNVEGDQSKKSYGDGGEVIDNDYDNDIDEDDWEKAWGDFLDDEYDKYGY